MSEPNDPSCPECGTPRAADGTPACACTARASEARREARSAEAAAAEDFDPVRIRPFVDLTEHTEASPPVGEVPSGAEDVGPGDSTAAPPDPAAREPAVPEAERPDPAPRPARSRTVLLTASGATLAVLLTGAYLGGLFTYDNPSRGEAAPGGLRAPVPAGAAPDGTSAEGTTAGTASAPPPSGSRAPGTAASGTPAPPDDTTAAPPRATPSHANAPSAPAPEPSDGEALPPVLRVGDRGPEVTELQLRLRQAGLYAADADGAFDRGLESAVRAYQLTRVVLTDESGVYGTATRTALESETTEP